MRLLIETMDLEEVNNIRFLLESNGIPIFVGNEDSARNMGFMLPARKYGVFVVYDAQLDDAQCLLKDENHVVEHKIDMEEYWRNMEMIKPNALEQMLKGSLIVLAIVAAFLVALIAWDP